MNMKIKILILLILLALALMNDEYDTGKFSIARIHYQGGGDWYSDPSSLPNLLSFIKENTLIEIHDKEKQVKIGDNDFNLSSYLYITGHGNIKLSKKEIATLRNHLLEGAFLHADDNYGMDPSFRKLMSQIFPDKKLVEIPLGHDLFNIYYQFENGLPKIHEHDNKRPQALGIFHNNRLVLLYTYESDLGDGWESQKVHNDPEDLRNQALKMGTNIIIYSLLQ